MPPSKTGMISQLMISLEGISPLIWRRVQLPAQMTLPQVHRVLQIVVGWENYHLHEFSTADRAYGQPDPEDHHFGREVADERRVPISRLLPSVGFSCCYRYDFGDNWRHDILLEAILPAMPRKRYPVCLSGAQSPPPEDVGGVGGYERYLTALSDMKHKDHKAMLEWRGRFDPEYFPVTSVNLSLKAEFPIRREQASDAVGTLKQTPSRFENGLSSILRTSMWSDCFSEKKRIVIGPDDPIPVPLTARDRELIVDYSFAELEIVERLKPDAGNAGKSQICSFHVDDLEHLTESVAAEANHSDKKMEKEWEVLYERLAAILEGYSQSD